MLNAGPQSDRLTLALEDASPHPAIEMWTAELITLSRTNGAPSRTGACSLVRVDLDDPEWMKALRAVSPTAREVGFAFDGTCDAAEIDEEVLYADSLVILDEELQAVSAQFGPLLVAVAKVFRNDVVAMLDRRTAGNDVHSAPGNFAFIPGTRVAMLPFYLRR